MDVIHDIEEKTVMAIIGDVSEYGNSVQTVNFHDYNKVQFVLTFLYGYSYFFNTDVNYIFRVMLASGRVYKANL